MAELGQVAHLVRSKNAGPFWLTVDIFCGTPEAYQQVCEGLPSDRVAAALGTEIATLKRFEIPSLNVIKFSCPRPAIQGTRADRDMHGASFAALVAELPLT